jgi:hypothetical protein
MKLNRSRCTVRLPLIRPYALSCRTFNEFEPIIVEAGISTLRDRVCMTAAMLVLEPIFEADLASELYAYVPGETPCLGAQPMIQAMRTP